MESIACGSKVAFPNPASKGLPPLPAFAASAALGEGLVFREGIDGRAESLPSSEPDEFEVDEFASFWSAAIDTPSAPPDECLGAGVQVEDPVRTQRRAAARAGVSRGAMIVLALAGLAMFIRPAHVERVAAVSVNAPHLETMEPAHVAPPSVVTPASAPRPSPAALALATKPARPAVHPTTRPASRSPKASSARAKPPITRSVSARRHS